MYYLINFEKKKEEEEKKKKKRKKMLKLFNIDTVSRILK